MYGMCGFLAGGAIELGANLKESGHLRLYFEILPVTLPFLFLLLGYHWVNYDPYYALLIIRG